MNCLHVYLIQLCLPCRGRVSVQQFRDGVVLRMCCGLTLPCLLGFSTGSYCVATIPKSRFEFLVGASLSEPHNCWCLLPLRARTRVRACVRVYVRTYVSYGVRCLGASAASDV